MGVTILEVCTDCYLATAGYSEDEAGRPMPTVPVNVSPDCYGDGRCLSCEQGESWFSWKPCEGHEMGYGCTDGHLGGDRHHATIHEEV